MQRFFFRAKRIKNRIILIAIGIVSLELLLRLGGFLYSGWMNIRNEQAENNSNAVYCILAIGESTTADGGRHSWPSQLEALLNSRSKEIQFSVVNAGEPGSNTLMLLAGIEDKLDTYEPDMVVSMMGANDQGHTAYHDHQESRLISLASNLRTYKLMKLIWESLSDRIDPDSDEIQAGSYRLDHEASPVNDESIRYQESVASHLEAGNIEAATDVLEKMIEKDYNKEAALALLGDIYFDQQNLEKAQTYAAQAVSLDPDNYTTQMLLGKVYFHMGMNVKATAHFEKSLELENISDMSFNYLEKLYRLNNAPREKIESLYARKGIEVLDFSNRPTANVTQYHHNKLFRILKTRKIKYTAMQYPTRHMGELKSMFKPNEDILFISNQENFDRALEEGTYEEYFIDRCYNDFGHATKKGNELIAENVARAVLHELKSFQNRER